MRYKVLAPTTINCRKASSYGTKVALNVTTGDDLVRLVSRSSFRYKGKLYKMVDAFKRINADITSFRKLKFPAIDRW